MSQYLENKVAIVTGSGHGVGRAHALAFANQGAKVIVNDIGVNPEGEGGSIAPADETVAMIKENGGEAVANYDNIISLAGVLLNKPYEAYDRSEAIYHQIIALEPARWEAYYELAATLQVKADIPGALAILQQYKERYGARQELAAAEPILHNASTRSGDSTESP